MFFVFLRSFIVVVRTALNLQWRIQKLFQNRNTISRLKPKNCSATACRI